MKKVVGACAVPLLCIVLSSVVLIASPQFAQSLAEKTGSKHIETVKNVWNYFAGQEDLQKEFTVNEKTHLQDVKRLLQWLIVFTILIATVCAWSIHEKKNQKKIARYSIIVASLSVVIAFGISFGALFTFFHHVFFWQGNWIFGQESLLITTFPEDFFKYFFGAIGMLAIVFYAFSIYMLNRR